MKLVRLFLMVSDLLFAGNVVTAPERKPRCTYGCRFTGTSQATRTVKYVRLCYLATQCMQCAGTYELIHAITSYLLVQLAVSAVYGKHDRRMMCI